MMNIYDCFQYFDEDLLLDIRLNVLNQYVKKFVITEATYTHNGAKKELNFNINNFKKFKDKINYLVIEQPPANLLEFVKNEPEHEKGEKLILNGMARDYFQRERLAKGFENADENDIILISDLDEIPNLTNVNFANIKNKIIIFFLTSDKFNFDRSGISSKSLIKIISSSFASSIPLTKFSL